MTIREATQQDLPSIVHLLKQSLGDSTIPKSESLWKWKHQENPFGSSYVILAEENGEVIGVRAFMKWKWNWNQQSFNAIRAVDTATHPQHQGKGIFKKLTLQQIELCAKDGVDFVFNTPNDQSRPGYLKMGWKQQGKMPLKINVTNPVSTALQVLLKKAPPAIKDLSVSKEEWQNMLSKFQSKTPLSVEGIHTPFSVAYLKWRYATNPLFPYGFISDHSNYILVYRIKEHPRYRELRITDFFLFNHSPAIRKEISRKIRQISREFKTNAVTLSGNQYQVYRKYFSFLGLIPVKSFGPIVTLREVNKSTEIEPLLKTENWLYSIGDLELF